MMRMLDTNAFVELRRGHKAVVDLVRSASRLSFSFFVLGELLFGFRSGSRYQDNVAELEAFLEHSDVEVAWPTWDTADRFARISTALRRAGTPIPSNDIWIAAQALETGAELLTYDRHFDCVAGLPVVILGRD